jgi:hypothetical protein
MIAPGSALPAAATIALQEIAMSTRRFTVWWFRFLISGRFLEKFFNLKPSRGS